MKNILNSFTGLNKKLITYLVIAVGGLILLFIVLGIIGFLCVKDGNMQNLMNFISKVNSKFSLYASLAFVLILVLEVIGTFFCYFASIKVMEKRERLCLE